MRYESRLSENPKRMLDAMRPHQANAVLRARAAFQAGNPWRPVDWPAIARQQKGAADAMREGERTQRQHEMKLSVLRMKHDGTPRELLRALREALAA